MVHRPRIGTAQSSQVKPCIGKKHELGIRLHHRRCLADADIFMFFRFKHLLQFSTQLIRKHKFRQMRLINMWNGELIAQQISKHTYTSPYREIMYLYFYDRLKSPAVKRLKAPDNG